MYTGRKCRKDMFNSIHKTVVLPSGGTAMRLCALVLVSIVALFMILPVSARSWQDWDAVGDETVELLLKYLKINTINPPGNVVEAAEYLYGLLDEAGVPVEMIWTNRDNGKVNVLARHRGSGGKRPLMLLNHMDTVPYDRDAWTVDPLGAVRKEGYIYGRGALDMKNYGIVQLMTMVLLERNNVKLDRDVMFLAVCDEEGGSFGTSWINRNMKDEIDPEFVLDEGGFGTQGFFTNDDRLIFSVGVAEKRNYTMRLSAEGTPGHASMPPEDNANFILARALGRIADYQTPEIRTNVTDEMKRRLGTLAKTPYNNALLRNTISLTIMRGYVGERGKSNVIPGRAEATIDCRLLPGQDPLAFVKDIENVIDDPRVKIRNRGGTIINDVSSFDNELFRIIEREAKKVFPGSLTLPHLIIYATDSRHFRRRGATCYGFFPGPVSMEEYRTIHGDDERIREESLRQALRVYYNVVKSFCEKK